jgi:histidine triad (HIT) family protein
MACLFCQLIKGQKPSYKIYEDSQVLAFLDINPSSPGHTLIIPKQHVSKVEDLSENDFTALFRVLHKLIIPIRESVGAEASTIGINNGPGSGQEIEHVHIHVIPRHRGDMGKIIQSITRTERVGNLDQIAKKIRENLHAII